MQLPIPRTQPGRAREQGLTANTSGNRWAGEQSVAAFDTTAFGKAAMGKVAAVSSGNEQSRPGDHFQVAARGGSVSASGAGLLHTTCNTLSC
ncbi:MAG: hypothetical protein ABGZ17_22565 [Planctomycetaceae bacterium]